MVFFLLFPGQRCVSRGGVWNFVRLCALLSSARRRRLALLFAPALDEDGCEQHLCRSHAFGGRRCACAYHQFAPAAAETDLRRSVLQGRRAPVACKINPSSTSERNLKNFGRLAFT